MATISCAHDGSGGERSKDATCRVVVCTACATASPLGKPYRACVGIALAVLALAGCGGDGGDGQTVAPGLITSQSVQFTAPVSVVAPANGSVMVSVSADVSFTNGTGAAQLVDVVVGAAMLPEGDFESLYGGVDQEVTQQVASGEVWSATATPSRRLIALTPGRSYTFRVYFQDRPTATGHATISNAKVDVTF